MKKIPIKNMYIGENVQTGVWRDPDGREYPIVRKRTAQEVILNILFQKEQEKGLQNNS